MTGLYGCVCVGKALRCPQPVAGLFTKDSGSRVLKSVLLPLILVSILLCAGCSQSGTAEGVVEYKAIYGMMGKSYYAIVVAGSPDGAAHIVTYDKELRGYFPSEGDLVVTDSLEKELEARYTNLDYIVSMRILSEGKPSQYLSGFHTNLQVFNEATLGGKVKFEYSPSSLGPEIVGCLE
jgi:hypothetical protein